MRNNAWIFVSQLVIAATYFFFHAQNILKLELWSDEILSLTIASKSFFLIAGNAMKLDAFPPYFYWELSLWLNVLSKTPPMFTEFIYRIPPMVYHTFGAMLFSLVVSKYFDIGGRSTFVRQAVRYLAFLLYFVNPILFPFAFELRPYAMMTFYNVLVIAFIQAERIYTPEFTFVQLFLNLISVFFAIVYIPIAVVGLFSRNSRRYAILTLILSAVLYLPFLSYFPRPSETTIVVTAGEIIRVYNQFRGYFVPTVFHVVFFIAAIFILIRKRKNTLMVFEILFCFFIITLAGAVFHYQAFAPRHLIIAVPFILATMCLPFTVKSNIVFYCTCGALLVGFLIPWGLTSEKSINHLSFAPKISIGIKEAVVSASRQHTHIYLDTNDQNRTSASFYTFTYFEDQSLWYIERDTKTAPLRLTAGHLCEASRDARNFIISFRNLPCLRGKTNAAVLKIHILDLPG